MNWVKIIKLLLPIFLRKSYRLSLLIDGLLYQTIGDSGKAMTYRDRMMQESCRIGQKMVVEGVLAAEFGAGIRLVEGEVKEPMVVGSDVPLVRLVGNPTPTITFPSMENVDLGYDVGVEIPDGYDVDRILATVRRYVFPGVIVYKVDNTVTL